MKLAVCAALGILMLLLTTSSSSAYKVCAEWVNEYHGYQENLNNNDENAQGFYNELSSDSYWSGAFIYGDDLAWESDWKDPSKGGHDDVFVDDAHFAFFSGHGSMTGFYFGTEHDDHKLSNGDALWGNKKMDWIAIDACEVLRDEWWSHVTWRWGDAFEGLHSICGFHTTTHDVKNRGSIFAKRMDGTWAEWTIIQAWIQAAKDTEGSDTYVAALAADADGNDNTYDCWNDHIYGHGSQVNPPADPPFWWYGKYQC